MALLKKATLILRRFHGCGPSKTDAKARTRRSATKAAKTIKESGFLSDKASSFVWNLEPEKPLRSRGDKETTKSGAASTFVVQVGHKC